ncbi:UNVERIFIED_CONTAM: hypothetical protein FKN15_000211 [Acipenser sinensis]
MCIYSKCKTLSGICDHIISLSSDSLVSQSAHLDVVHLTNIMPSDGLKYNDSSGGDGSSRGPSGGNGSSSGPSGGDGSSSGPSGGEPLAMEVAAGAPLLPRTLCPVGNKRQPQAMRSTRQPKAMQSNRQPQAMQSNRQPQAMRSNRQPQAIQDRHPWAVRSRARAVLPMTVNVEPAGIHPLLVEGMYIKSTYDGLHVITGTTENSPADLCKKIHAGDEVIQVNHQTVVGWQLKNLVNALREDPNGVILTLKKRPQNTLTSAPALLKNVRWKPLALQPIPTSPNSCSTTPTNTMGMSSKMDSSNMHDVFILSPVSGLYGPREEMGIMSCDEYGMGKSGMKGSESPSYFLDHESGKYYTLMEGEGISVGPDYERGRSTGVRRRERTPTHGDLRPVSMPMEYSWIGETKEPNMYKRGSRGGCLRSEWYIPKAAHSAHFLKMSFHYASLRTKTKKRTKGSLTSGSRRRISCKDLGHGDCEGWLWKKKDAKGYFIQKWKKYWFILKDSSLYWYTNQNLITITVSLCCSFSGAEGFISLPEFRIDRAIECRRKFAFKACHPKIKSFFFATDCLEEMNRWMNRLGLAAIGYTPDDKVLRPDEDYWSESDQDDIDGSLTLKQEGPSSTCDTYHRTPSVNSSSPFPEPKHGRHFSSESTYSQSSAEDSRQDPTGSTHSSGCRSSYRERRSWQDLIETPLTSSGLHFLQTVPSDPEYTGGRPGMSPEQRRQATLPVQRRHHADRDGPFPLVGCERGFNPHRRAHKQRSQSLPRNRDARCKGSVRPAGLSEEKSEDEEIEFRKQNGSSKEEGQWEERERDREQESRDGLQELYKTLEQASLSAFGEQRPSTKQEFRRSFNKRCNDPVINEKLHRIRALRSTLKAKEGDLGVINHLLDDPNLTSKKFKEWKQRHHELFMDIYTYIYLKDPPPGFLPRVSVISVSGLAGLILARNGSRFKKVMLPLGLAAVGTSVCYPAQAVAAVKVSGKKVYAAGHWANGAVSSLWKPSPAKEAHAKLQSHESASVPVKVPNPDVLKGFDTPGFNAVPMPEVVPHVPEAVPDHTIETEVLSAEEAAPQDHLPASEPVDAALLEPASVLSAVPSELPASTETSSLPEAEQPATTKSHESLSQQKELEGLPEPSIPVSETPTGFELVLHSPAFPDLSEKPKFSPDPRLLDHGQSNPEDSDMYSTRS